MSDGGGSAVVIQQLAEIASRVRVRSITAFECLDRTIEVEPPLPQRHPPIPMIERLQGELYGNAYCARIDGTGFSGDAQREQALGSDMLAALSAANASRTRVDPGWLVLDVDQLGAVSVAKYGAVRRIPLTDITSESSGRKRATSASASAGAVGDDHAAARNRRAGRLLLRQWGDGRFDT